MKIFTLILLLCLNTLVFAQEDPQIQKDNWFNIGLKTTIHNQPHHQPFVTPYLSFKINRVEIGGIWWKYNTNDPKGIDHNGQPAIDLESEHYRQLAFINVFIDRSKNWYIGLGHSQSNTSRSKYDRISGLIQSDIIDPTTGQYSYYYGNKHQVFEVNDKTKTLFLSSGLKIPIIKNFIVQPEIKLGLQHSKQTVYRQRIENPDDMEDIANSYWLRSVDQYRASIMFGLDIIYQIPL